MPVSRRALPLAAVGLALAFALFGPPLPGTLAPWLVLGGVLIAATLRTRRAKRHATELARAEELFRLRRPEAAFHAADALLDEFVHEPAASARCTLVMGRALLTLRRPEEARVATGVLLERLPDLHPARTPVLLSRAVAEFECDRLADGDATLGKLRATLEREDAPPAQPPAPPADDAPDAPPGDRRGGRPFAAPDRTAAEHAAAAYRAARLVQSAFTWHAADAIADAEAAGGAEASFRPLGVEAGFAHGLLAWCHLQLRDAAAAAAAWERATRLVPASALVHRFPRLTAVAEACPADGGLPA